MSGANRINSAFVVVQGKGRSCMILLAYGTKQQYETRQALSILNARLFGLCQKIQKTPNEQDAGVSALSIPALNGRVFRAN
ncbi:MAG: hypothetical protein P8179_16740 [Candidatus Thiodiazotropha sp.]